MTRKKIGLAFVFLLLFVLGTQAFLSARTQAVWHLIERDLQFMDRAGTPERSDRVQTTLLRLQDFAASHPLHASAWEMQGDHQWRFANSEIKGLAMPDIPALYREAITRQPAKARYWAKLAYSKALANEFDPGFYQAYENAFALGGYEYDVARSIMEIGLAYWYRMGVEYRLILKEETRRLYGVEPIATLELAEQYGQLHMVCIWVRDAARQFPRCQRELADKNEFRRNRK